MKNPIGVSDYQFSKAVPEELSSQLPGVEDLENELVSQRLVNRWIVGQRARWPADATDYPDAMESPVFKARNAPERPVSQKYFCIF